MVRLREKSFAKVVRSFNKTCPIIPELIDSRLIKLLKKNWANYILYDGELLNDTEIELRKIYRNIKGSGQPMVLGIAHSLLLTWHSRKSFVHFLKLNPGLSKAMLQTYHLFTIRKRYKTS